MAATLDQSLAMNEDQQLIRESALRFLEEQEPIAELRSLRDGEEPSGVSPAFWDEISALGWPGLLAPESFGGSGLGFQELGVVFEALGRHVVSTPLFSSGVLATSALTLVKGWGNLPKAADLATGAIRVALGLEETSRFDLDRIETLATRDGQGYRLSGRKRPVLDAATADLLLVVARIDGDEDLLGLFCLPPGIEGIGMTPLRWIDGRRAVELRLDDVVAGGDALLGPPLPRRELLDSLLDRAATVLAAELVGISAEAFDMTVQFLKTREQFDQTLAEFQALQHRCARMFSEIERTISLVQEALRALDEGGADASMLASAAKAMASDTARHVTEEALQLFGGLGMTEEQDIGLYFKRARTSSLLFGDAPYHYRRYARLNGF
jgi:alkylation response protein AidB-like acyl-CoA dehydrogenase